MRETEESLAPSPLWVVEGLTCGVYKSDIPDLRPNLSIEEAGRPDPYSEQVYRPLSSTQDLIRVKIMHVVRLIDVTRVIDRVWSKRFSIY